MGSCVCGLIGFIVLGLGFFQLLCGCLILDTEMQLKIGHWAEGRITECELVPAGCREP